MANVSGSGLLSCNPEPHFLVSQILAIIGSYRSEPVIVSAAPARKRDQADLLSSTHSNSPRGTQLAICDALCVGGSNLPSCKLSPAYKRGLVLRTQKLAPYQ